MDGVLPHFDDLLYSMDSKLENYKTVLQSEHRESLLYQTDPLLSLANSIDAESDEPDTAMWDNGHKSTIVVADVVTNIVDPDYPVIIEAEDEGGGKEEVSIDISQFTSGWAGNCIVPEESALVSSWAMSPEKKEPPPLQLIEKETIVKKLTNEDDEALKQINSSSDFVTIKPCKVLVDRLNLANHLESLASNIDPSMVAVNKLICEFCPKTFCSQKLLECHLQTVHRSEEIFHCKKCCFSCKDQKLFLFHIKEAHSSRKPPTIVSTRQYRCPQCSDKIFLSAQSLSGHMNRHSNKPRKNGLLSKSLSSPMNRPSNKPRKHVLVSKKLSCPGCKESFDNKITMQVHMKKYNCGLMEKSVDDAKKVLKLYEDSLTARPVIAKKLTEPSKLIDAVKISEIETVPQEKVPSIEENEELTVVYQCNPKPVTAQVGRLYSVKVDAHQNLSNTPQKLDIGNLLMQLDFKKASKPKPLCKKTVKKTLGIKLTDQKNPKPHVKEIDASRSVLKKIDFSTILPAVALPVLQNVGNSNCLFCPAAFDSLAELQAHQKNSHYVVCRSCSEKLSFEESKTHVCRKNKCNFCNTFHSTKEGLINHLTEVHNAVTINPEKTMSKILPKLVPIKPAPSIIKLISSAAVTTPDTPTLVKKIPTKCPDEVEIVDVEKIYEPQEAPPEPDSTTAPQEECKPKREASKLPIFGTSCSKSKTKKTKVAGFDCINCSYKGFSLPLLKKHIKEEHPGMPLPKILLAERPNLLKKKSPGVAKIVSSESLDVTKVVSSQSHGVAKVVSPKKYHSRRKSEESRPDITNSLAYNMLLGRDTIYEFQCSQCLAYFSSQKALQKHKLDHKTKSTTLIKKRKSQLEPNVYSKKPKLKQKVSKFEKEKDLVNEILNAAIREEIPESTDYDSEADFLEDANTMVDEVSGFICEECPLTFDTLMDLQAHLETFHFREIHEVPMANTDMQLEIETSGCRRMEFICDMCGEIFSLLNDITNHITSHLVKPNLYCSPFQSKMVTCTICKEDIQDVFLYSHLIVAHSNFLPEKFALSCSACNFNCIEVSSFFRHLRLKHKRTVLECPLCRMAYTHLDYLKQHAFNNHGIDISEFREVQPRLLVQIKETASNEELDPPAERVPEEKLPEKKETPEPPPPKPMKKVKCNQCMLRFEDKKSLKRHKYIKHLRTLLYLPVHKPNQKIELSSEVTRTNFFVCQTCCEPFTRQNLLQLHVCKSFRGRKPKPMDCNLCQYTCASKYVLAMHLIHQHSTVSSPEVVSVKCRVCKAVFDQREELYQHRRVEHKQTCFCCFACGMCFQKFDSLSDHLVSGHGFADSLLSPPTKAGSPVTEKSPRIWLTEKRKIYLEKCRAKNTKYQKQFCPAKAAKPLPEEEEEEQSTTTKESSPMKEKQSTPLKEISPLKNEPPIEEETKEEEKVIREKEEPTAEENVKEAEPVVEDKVNEEEEPAVEDKVKEEEKPAVEEKVKEEEEPAVEEKVKEEEKPAIEEKVKEKEESAVEEIVKDEEPAVEAKEVIEVPEDQVDEQQRLEVDAKLSRNPFVRLLMIPSLTTRKCLSVKLPKRVQEDNLEKMLTKALAHKANPHISTLRREKKLPGKSKIIHRTKSIRTENMLRKWHQMNQKNSKILFYKDARDWWQCRICKFRSLVLQVIKFHTRHNHSSEAKGEEVEEEVVQVKQQEEKQEVPPIIEDPVVKEENTHSDNLVSQNLPLPIELEQQSPLTFECNFCGMVVATARGLKLHFGHKHKKKAMSKRVPKFFPEKDKKVMKKSPKVVSDKKKASPDMINVPCTLCCKNFKSNFGLKMHQVRSTTCQPIKVEQKENENENEIKEEVQQETMKLEPLDQDYPNEPEKAIDISSLAMQPVVKLEPIDIKVEVPDEPSSPLKANLSCEVIECCSDSSDEEEERVEDCKEAKARHIFCLNCNKDYHLAGFSMHLGLCYRQVKKDQKVNCSLCNNSVECVRLMAHVAKHMDTSAETQPMLCKLCSILLFNHSNYLHHNLEVHM